MHFLIIQYWIKIGHPIIQTLKIHLMLLMNTLWRTSLVRRHTNAKILIPEWLRRDGIFIDYQRHDNDFTQNFRIKRTYPYSKQNIRNSLNLKQVTKIIIYNVLES